MIYFYRFPGWASHLLMVLTACQVSKMIKYAIYAESEAKVNFHHVMDGLWQLLTGAGCKCVVQEFGTNICAIFVRPKELDLRNSIHI